MGASIGRCRPAVSARLAPISWNGTRPETFHLSLVVFLARLRIGGLPSPSRNPQVPFLRDPSESARLRQLFSLLHHRLGYIRLRKGCAIPSDRRMPGKSGSVECIGSD